MCFAKKEIYSKLNKAREEIDRRAADLKDSVSVLDYSGLVRTGIENNKEVEIWSDAFCAALSEHETVHIPASDNPYYIDKTIIIPSNRCIRADKNAVIRQMSGVRVLMLRNENTLDGTKKPISGKNKDVNISISGGRWEESHTCRAGYGSSGMYDEERSYFGVSACMFFNNIQNLKLTDMIFAHTAGFAVQTGDIKNAVFENIEFEECYADGLHINGNAENIIVRNIKGQVGDDLVALNMYDWQNSSVDFGPVRTVLCENLELSADSRYKAFRIEPGIYYYEDGSSVDCFARDIIIKNVRGISTYKLYFQTPQYHIGEFPENGGTGSGDNIFFEDIEIDLDGPIDRFSEYLNSDPIRGSFAGFELGANIENIYFDNINIKLYKEKYPMSFLICAGPKSVRIGDTEVFDPYLDSTVGKIELKNIRINGEMSFSINDVIHEIKFYDINSDGNSTAEGKIKKIIRF